MSVFVLKIIAVVLMVIDHISYILSFSTPDNIVLYLMRLAGRVSFPIFCFLIVNGLEKTRDRQGYVARLGLFALISQLPFSTAFSYYNYQPAVYRGLETALKINPETLRLLPLMLTAALICFFVFRRKKADRNFFYILAALLLPLFGLKIRGYTLLNLDLNVFYTLAVSLAIICVLDELIFRRKERGTLWLSLAIAAVAAASFYILPFSDYSYRGPLLIVLLYLAKDKRWLQAFEVIIWGQIVYGPFPEFTFVMAISALLIFLYNGKKGPAFKLGFYLIYPVHLLLLFLLLNWLI